jgi:hypothetical protein
MGGRQAVVLRARRSAYVLAGLIFGSPTLLSGLAAITDKRLRGFFLLWLACWIFSYAWLALFLLVVSDESLRYRSLFGGSATFRLSQIHRISMEVGVRRWSDRFKPNVRLIVECNPEVRRSHVYVNLQVFGRARVRPLLDDLRARFSGMGRPEVVRNL